jgi:hypothetical protein
MRLARFTGSALAALLVSSVLAVTAAQANEGPFYKVGGARLEAGLSHELKARGLSNQVFKGESFGFPWTITCVGLKLKVGSSVNGGVPGGGKETLEYAGCTQTGMGSACEVESKEFTTYPLKTGLVYSEAGHKGFVDVVFSPESGEQVGRIKLTGTCLYRELPLAGSVAAERRVNKVRDAVGKGAEAQAAEIWFPATQIKTVWKEATETPVGLNWAGSPMTIEGKSERKLVGEPLWGVATE